MKCVDCSNGVAFGCKYCVKCLEKAKKRSAERYQRIKRDKRCKSCSEPVGESSGIYCQACKDQRKTTWHKRRKLGLCVTCGKANATNGRQCKACHSAHIESVRVRREDRLSKGQCVFCDEPRVGTRLCRKHYLQFTAKTHLGTVKRYQELERLFEQQDGVCPYTKNKLTLGVDASIDHIVPKSRGGKNDLSNLHWVHFQVNFMKGDMLHEEFVVMIKSIYENSVNSTPA